MTLQEPRTLLEQLIAGGQRPWLELEEEFARHARALHQETGERMVSRSWRHLQRIAAGEVTRPQAATRRVLERQFGRPIGELLGPPTASTVDDMRRRAFLGSVVAASVGVALSGPNLTDIKPASYFTAALHTLIDNDNIFGPADVIPRAERHIAEIGHAWTSARGADRAELIHLRTRFAELVAWFYEDFGDHTAAQQWTDRALEWSYLTGDLELTSMVLVRKTQLACDMRDPDTATGLGPAAVKLASHVKFAAAATVHAAHGHALAGDRTAAERGYDTARELAGRSDDAYEWGEWLDDSYIDVHRALSLSELGDHQRAADVFDRALQVLPGGFHRDRGVYLARAAHAYAGAREFDHAATLGTQSLCIATETRSGRTATELLRLGQELATANTSVVRQFRDLLRTSSLVT